MGRRCDVTGIGTMYGNAISHSHLKTRRIWKANIIKKKIFLEDENRWVTLKLSTRALRTLQKKGIKAAMKDNQMSLEALKPKKYKGIAKKKPAVKK